MQENWYSSKLEPVFQTFEAGEDSNQSRDRMSNGAELMFPEIAYQSSNNNSMTSDEPKRRCVVKSHLNLLRAAMRGDWETIKSLLDIDPNAKTADISGCEETVLHVAVKMGHTSVVQKLLKILPPDVLTKQDIFGATALHVAAKGESLEIVKALVEENPMLTQILQDKETPLLVAARYSNGQVVRYLCEKTGDDAPGCPFSGPSSGDLIVMLIYSGYYDVAINLLHRYPLLATAVSFDRQNLLTSLSYKPFDFLSGSGFKHWELWIYHLVPVKINNMRGHGIPRSDGEDPQHQNLDIGKKPMLRKYMGQVLTRINRLIWKVMAQLVPRIKYIEQEKLKHGCTNELIHYACEGISNLEEEIINNSWPMYSALGNAAENGITEIVAICLQYFPSVTGMVFLNSKTIIRLAIEHRREKIFNLLYGKTALSKEQSANYGDGETLLHAVAKVAPYPQLRAIPCPAIQMQREIQWFKAIEHFIQPFMRPYLNVEYRTAEKLFTINHMELVKEAEKWMKDTSNSCMLVSTLIATVVFAAAFTVPGGNLESKGTPIFLKETKFMIFAISDALALFSSITSVLMFLSILTARYAEKDFLYALPKRLILGLASLFVSIAAMMVAFGSALQIILSERWQWFYIPTVVLGALPVLLFMMLQFPMFIDMVWSTYGPSIFRPQSIW